MENNTDTVMRWVKASERRPTEKDVYHVRVTALNLKGTAQFTGKMFEGHFINQFTLSDFEWLEELPAPPNQ